MPLRFFRRVRIAPGLSLNLSKSGASVSVGPKGAKVTVGPKGVRKTVGLPGTGVYYTTTSRLHGVASDTAEQAPTPVAPTRTGARGFWGRRSRKGKATIVVAALLAIGALNPTAAATPTPTTSRGGAAPGRTSAPSQAVVRTQTPAARTTAPSLAAAITPAETTVAAPKPTPKPTAKPTPRPTPRPTAKPKPKPIGVFGNPWGYDFRSGTRISSPPGDFCSYFNCIASFWTSTNGYVVQCVDGTFSHSGGRSGVCSYHGGYRRTLFRH